MILGTAGIGGAATLAVGGVALGLGLGLAAVGFFSSYKKIGPNPTEVENNFFVGVDQTDQSLP